MQMVQISSSFDAGNIEVESISSSDEKQGGEVVSLMVKDDPFSTLEQKHFKQWFYFRVSGCKNKHVRYCILNAGECAYPEGFRNYTVCASNDRKFWFRIPTVYDDEAGTLSWCHNTPCDQVYYAYFAPFSQEQHLDLIAECLSSGNASVTEIGKTLDQRPMDMVTIGSGPMRIWAIARQHPGESQGGYWMQGFLRRLLDKDDALSRTALTQATFRIIPCMNPDGAFRGHLRTNASGANLNREWRSSGGYEAPSLARSPEVYHVLSAINEFGCDMFMDLHGDEKLPYNFISGSEGVPKWGPRLKDLQHGFVEALMKANPDMQDSFKYPINPPCGANLTVASKHIAETFDCLSFTIEMPYKDTANQPCPEQGWSPERARKFGESFVMAVATVIPKLR